MSDSDEFAGMSDPQFLAERKRVRETLEALTERYRGIMTSSSTEGRESNGHQPTRHNRASPLQRLPEEAREDAQRRSWTASLPAWLSREATW